jgi:hypothetical protein
MMISFTSPTYAVSGAQHASLPLLESEKLTLELVVGKGRKQ